MELKPGYKQTEVGVIPKDWEVSNLRSLATMKSGESITSTNIDNFSRYPCYGGNGLRGYTSRFTHDGRHALIGRQGALCGNVIGVEGPFFASEHAVVVTSYPQIDIRWLTFVLGNMRLNRFSESSAQPGLSVAKILNLYTAIPPTKAEQEAIAEALSEADARPDSLEQLIAKKRQIKQGAMQVLLTGKRRLPKFVVKPGYKKTEMGVIPADWSFRFLATEIKEMTDYVAAGSFESLRNNIRVYDTPQYATYVRLYDLRLGLGHNSQKYVDETSYKFLSKSNLRGKEILVANIGANVGEAFIMPTGIGPATIAPNMIVVRSDDSKVRYDYLFYYISSNFGQDRIRELIAGSGHPKINKTDLKKLKLLVPSLPEQEAIATVLTDMDTEITTLETKLAKARQIKQGMMQELLTGRIRLI